MVQAVHAAIQATTLFPSTDPYLVVLAVESEPELLRLNHRLKAAGIDCAPFFERDHPAGFNALATKPLRPHEREHLAGIRSWHN